MTDNEHDLIGKLLQQNLEPEEHDRLVWLLFAKESKHKELDQEQKQFLLALEEKHFGHGVEQ